MKDEVRNLDFLKNLSEDERDIFYENRKVELQRKYELKRILRWFKETDYIELQAIRGTISREDEKYINYLSEYDKKLERYRELAAKTD